MSASNLAAEILEMSAPAFARSACLRIEEALARLATDKSLQDTDWRADAMQRISDLIASLRLGKPELFVEKARWLARAYAARGISVDVPRCALQSLRAAIAEDFPGDSATPAVDTVDKALSALELPLEPAVSALNAKDRFGALSLKYLALSMDGCTQDAIALIVEAINDGVTPEDAVTKVALPAQREIGELWHMNEVTIAQEHLVTNTTLDLLVVIGDRYAEPVQESRTALIASVAGNAHDIGIRATSVMFRLAGWKPVMLGTDLPADEIAAAAEHFNADIVILSATIATQVQAVRNTIAVLKENFADRPVIVGGGAFSVSPELWREIGASALSHGIDTVVEDAGKLLRAAAN